MSQLVPWIPVIACLVGAVWFPYAFWRAARERKIEDAERMLGEKRSPEEEFREGIRDIARSFR